MDTKLLTFADLYTNKQSNGLTDAECYMQAGFKVKNKAVAKSSVTRYLRRPEVDSEIKRLTSKINDKIIARSAWTKERLIDAHEKIVNLALNPVPVYELKEVVVLGENKKPYKTYEPIDTFNRKYDPANAERALENIGKITGAYELDNNQKANMTEVLLQLQAKIGIINIEAS